MCHVLLLYVPVYFNSCIQLTQSYRLVREVLPVEIPV